MNSRFVPLVTALVTFLIAAFFVLYFQSMWRWVVASPLLVFVTWPSLKVGLFASQDTVDKMTGADKF